MLWVLGLVFRAWQFRVISPRRCICKKFPDQTKFQGWIVKFRVKVFAKGRNKRKGAKNFTPSGRLENTFSGRQLDFVQIEDICNFQHNATGRRETMWKEVGDAKRSHLEQVSSSVPKVKEQTDVKNTNSLKASLATSVYKNPLFMVDKMNKIVMLFSASSRVSWLQVWKQMHLWHSLLISTCWWWEVTTARGREKKVLKEQLLFWGKEESKVVYLKIQIQWIEFYGKLETWDWMLRRDTPWNGYIWYKIKIREKKEGNLEALSKKVNLMSEILARPVLRNEHLKKPHDKQIVTAK